MDKLKYFRFDLFTLLTLLFNMFMLGIGITYVYFKTSSTTNIEQSRLVQQCEVIGRSLNCQQNTAWYEEDRCSCSVSNERRITYLLDQE